MEKVIISVIVPVYNCYFYLEECLKSIVKQNFKLFELIIVNDCSEDDSKEIIDFYEKKYDNIKAIHLNKNRGVSYARNTGLNIAQGEFVVFLDADDKITPNMLSYMYNCIKKYNCDLVVCNVLRIEGKNRKTQTHSIGSYSMIITSENIKDYIINYMLEDKHKYCVWNRIYKMGIIKDNNIKFLNNDNIYPEDLMFNLQYIYYVKKLFWINETLYTHISRKNSITNSYRNEIFYRYINMCYEFYNYSINNFYKIDEELYYSIVVEQFFNAITASIKKNNTKFLDLYNNVLSFSNEKCIYKMIIYHNEKKLLRRLVLDQYRKKNFFLSTLVIYFLIKKSIIKKI